MSTQATALLGGAIVVAAVILALAFGGQTPAPHDTDTVSEAPIAGDARAPGSEDQPLEPSLRGETTEQRLARLQRALEDAQAEIRRLQEDRTNEGGEASAGTAPRSAAATKKLAARFFELGKIYSSGEATKEQVAELMRLTSDKALMQAVVADLETRIAKDPNDLEARMQLVDVQSARVHSAESIAERGILRESVQTQLKEVLQRDAENWDARYMQAVGISHSQRTPQGRARAIQAFESLIALQQQKSAEPRFAKTYSQLAGVHLAEKDSAKARAALLEGLRRYPDDESLKKMLDGLPAEGG